MTNLLVRKSGRLLGEITVPGDKSISHRAVLLAGCAEGPSRITGFLPSEDCQNTLRAVESLGVPVRREDSETVLIEGRGLRGLLEPENLLDLGNSGTGIRLLAGLLSGQPFFSVLTGDESLRRRPMRRIVEPLRRMGAWIDGRAGGDRAPLAIRGGGITGIEFISPIASAQVKSAVLLAGLFAEGTTTVREPSPSRDHTERLLDYLGAPIRCGEKEVAVEGKGRWRGREIRVPGDLSSAAFLITAALVVPDSEIVIRGVGVNPTRTGLLDILKAMGGRIEEMESRTISGEPTADLKIHASALKGVVIGGALIPRMVDELPVLCIAAAAAEGETMIRDAAELRAKESDRIAAMAQELRKMGVEIKEHPDGMTIRGGKGLRGAVCSSHGDHRVAMSMAVAGLIAEGETTITDAEWIDTSFPGFVGRLAQIGGRVG